MQTRNPQSRQAVESGKLATRNGIRTLDKIPDIRQTLLVSEVLNLDEVESYELIEEAFDQTGEVSAAVAAGLFYSKRLAAVRSLFTLLYAHVTGYGLVTDRIFEVVEKFNVELLSEHLEKGKETLLITNLCRSVRTTVAGMKDAAHSSMSFICDLNRRMVPRVDSMNLECLVSTCIQGLLSGSSLSLTLEICTVPPSDLISPCNANKIKLLYQLTVIDAGALRVPVICMLYKTKNAGIRHSKPFAAFGRAVAAQCCPWNPFIRTTCYSSFSGDTIDNDSTRKQFGGSGGKGFPGTDSSAGG